MNGWAVTSSGLDVYHLARDIDPPIRGLLTVLSMEMNWEHPVRRSYRGLVDHHNGIVAQWWTGECGSLFGAVKVTLWWNFHRGLHLEVVTGRPLPALIVEDLCRGLQAATALSVSQRAV